jgi:cytoskeleton protein RodZ
MKKTGLILKEAREAKGISIYEVSTATKINIKNILAMEDGAIEKLPPKTFLRGFVASYATYLQLDTASILKVFFEEMGSTRPEIEVREQYQNESKSASEKARDDKSILTDLTGRKKFNYFKIAGIVGILFLIFIVALVKRKMDSYESESITQNASITPTPSPVEITPSPTPSASPISAISPVATPVATPAPVATAAIVTSTPTPAPDSTPTPTPQPVSTASPTPKSTPNASPTPKPSPSPTAKAQEVIIEALNDVDVSMQIDSEPEKKMTLHHDEVQSIKARRKVSLKFSDGGAVNLTINGKDRGVPGDLGKPKKVDLP